MQDMQQQQQQQQHESENDDISADVVDVTKPPAASSMLEFTTLADLRAIRLTSQLLTFNRVLLRQIHT